MRIKEEIYHVYQKLKETPNIDVEEIALSEPMDVDDFDQIEGKLNFIFPDTLKNLYLNEAASISMIWNATGEGFGEYCKYGEINLISPAEIVRMVEDIRFEVKEFLKNKQDYEENEAVKAILDDWIYWIPVIKFRNGDAFCFDTRQPGYPVFFLEHDVMDGGPNLHGIKIATDFDKLFKNWCNVGFVDIYDWYEVSMENGVDFDNKIFCLIKKIL
ncbi:SMI1/KNR4 family protein [Bacillus sp. FJAT-29814]|uniref:SMI1/KNR4 family protein n=1 Tax=Bacillus sp. FJAT-29814 TaxID=1729688 RepID=UPI00082A5A2A|nr:SMI1/KNR4 family protein [Bacillus sp. FJAT-29814]